MKSREEIENGLHALMGAGKTNQVLKQLRHLVDDNQDLKEKWILAKGRWENINSRFYEGFVTPAAFNQDVTVFNRFLMTFINDVLNSIDDENTDTRKVFSEVEDKDDFFHVYSNLKTPSEVWSGFVNDFKSFNDPWLMEYICPEDYLDTHRKRYNDPACGKFYFQFFPNTTLVQGGLWKPFIRFAKFQALVHFGLETYQIAGTNFKEKLKEILEKPFPDTLKHIGVYLNHHESPNQTFFRGYKEQGESLERVSIWYLMLDDADELPTLILKSANEDFWMELDRKWNRSRMRSEVFENRRIFEKVLELPDKYFDHEYLIS